MNLNLDSLANIARNADQGAWSIGQSGIETNRGFIECTNDNQNVHVPNTLFVATFRPEVVLQLIELAKLGQRIRKIEEDYDEG